MPYPLEVVKIKIVSCARSTYWYSGLEEQVFDFYRDGTDADGKKRYVLKEDYDRGGTWWWRHISEPDGVEVPE